MIVATRMAGTDPEPMWVDLDPDVEDADLQCIKIYKQNLPTTAELISYTNLGKTMKGDQNDELTKAVRIARKGEYAKQLLIQPQIHNVILSRSIRKNYEMAKILFGFYESGLPHIDVLHLLREIIKHIDQQNIDAFYKTSHGKFVIVLKRKMNIRNSTPTNLTSERRSLMRILSLDFFLNPVVILKRTKAQFLLPWIS